MGLMWLTGFLIFQNKNDFCIHFNFAYVEIRRLGTDFFSTMLVHAMVATKNCEMMTNIKW